MATAIKIKYCTHCGQMESIRSERNYVDDRILITIWCACGAEPPRAIELGANEAYYLKVETRMEEATGHDDSGSGNVPAGREAGRESDV